MDSLRGQLPRRRFDRSRGLTGASRDSAAFRIAQFVLRRLARLAVVLIVILFVTGMMVRLLPGDPARLILGINASPQSVRAMDRSLGLDRSIWHQFFSYANHVFHLNLGTSFQTQQPVWSMIAAALPNTAEVAGAAAGLVLALSIPLGLLMGGLTRERRRPKAETAFTTMTSALGAIPEYLLATVLAYVFAVEFRWLPVAGAQGVSSLVLPVLAVSIPSLATLARLVRKETIGVLTQDYVRTARAKRLSRLTLYGRHVAPNVITGALTIGGLIFASLIGGTVIVENVFARYGLGSMLIQAVLNRDYPVVQGVILVLAAVIVCVNTLIDFALVAIDPRVANA